MNPEVKNKEETAQTEAPSKPVAKPNPVAESDDEIAWMEPPKPPQDQPRGKISNSTSAFIRPPKPRPSPR
ncbi:unnamed protein product [Mycena citricolor]|uniref:Uncharacterized protein n=1 Tax=Mycena citricolor TaxID=2018698 RepID=A0AAD2HH94_9AGAR|nr:unnamed protein product [Mycena citricolor]